MTARALELTDDPDERFGPQLTPRRTKFVKRCYARDLDEALLELTRPVLRARSRGNVWELESSSWTRASAFFIEAIQGEGGIHPVPRETAEAWQAACAARSVPLIVDEIQSGMGRTGSFLYVEQLGLCPDYVLLGKSLGGGLCKISAVAIALDHFLDAFSFQHASTFAEDDLSSAVALRALELLSEENALATAADRGTELREALLALARRHPTVIQGVRGAGLMLGLEWSDVEFEHSPVLRFLRAHGWLGYALAGYLLREHGVRVAPTLSCRRTMRLEPAYSLPADAVRDLLHGLEALCTLLEREDAAGILGPCLGALVPSALTRRSPRVLIRPPLPTSHVAFIGHFIEPEGVALWDPSFARLDTAACQNFLERIHPFAAPVLCHRGDVRSTTGEVTTVSFIGLPVSARQCHDALRRHDVEPLRRLVQRAVNFASEQGCSVVGLGGYCSILTRNGKDLSSNGVALTTGNGYTVGAGMLALQAAARLHGIPYRGSRAAVIGAAGNIGSVVASLLARDVSSLILIGPTGRHFALAALAGRILRETMRGRLTYPMARAIEGWHTDAIDPATTVALAEIYYTLKEKFGDELPVDIGTELRACQDASLVVTASNDPAPILYPGHLGEQPTVVIDLAVPGDVHHSILRECTNVGVIRGGVIRAPCNPEWLVPAIPLKPGEMFACMAETVLMGLERERQHGSLGSLTPERVLHILSLARKHGFTAIRSRTERSA